MNTNTMTDSTLSQRMEQLEQRMHLLQRADTRARRWKTTALVAGFAVIGLAGIAATQSALTPDVLRARRFEVVDQNDKIVMLAGIGQNGGQLDIWANSGTNVVRLGSNADGGDLAMWNNATQGVVSMYATSQGGRIEAVMPDGSGSATLRAEATGPAMVIADGENHPRIVATTSGTTTRFTVRSADGSEVVAIGALDGQGGTIRVAQTDGSIAAQMLAVENGGSIGCTNRAGSRAAFIESGSQDSGGMLTLYTADGSPGISALGQSEAGSRITLFNSQRMPAGIFQSGAIDTPMIAFLQNGNRVAGLGASTSGGILNLAQPDGKAVIVAGAAADANGGAISIRSGTGSQLVRLGVDRLGAGEVAVYDGPGTRSRVLSAIANAP